MEMSRRTLRKSSAAGLGVLGASAIQGFGLTFPAYALEAIARRGAGDGFGPLVPDPAGILELPQRSSRRRAGPSRGSPQASSPSTRTARRRSRGHRVESSSSTTTNRARPRPFRLSPGRNRSGRRCGCRWSNAKRSRGAWRVVRRAARSGAGLVGRRRRSRGK